MPDIHIKLDIPHGAQKQVDREERRFNVLNAGRRWGKNKHGERKAILELLKADKYTPALVGWYSPTYRMLQESWRTMRNILDPIKQAASAEEHRIEIATGGVLDMWSLDTPDSSRGRKYSLVIVDEAAMADSLQYAWENVIRQTLTDLQGKALFMSTPRGHNQFWKLWQLGQDPGEPEWMSWSFPTDTNPYIMKGEIEAARRMLPERVFAQEYLALFMDDSGEVFRGVDRACVLEPQEPIKGHVYCLGADWARSADYTCFSVIDATTGQQVFLDRFNQIDYTFQLGRLRSVVDKYKPAVILAESNSMGEPLIERVREAGIRVQSWHASNPSKNKAIEDLSLAIERGELLLLSSIIQKGELLSMSSSKTIGGFTRYAASPGDHDDTVMALAMAWQAVGKELPAPVPGHDPFATLTGGKRGGSHIEIITDPETGKTHFGVPKKAKSFLSFVRGDKE